jgi:hypothetical protein
MGYVTNAVIDGAAVEVGFDPRRHGRRLARTLIVAASLVLAGLASFGVHAESRTRVVPLAIWVATSGNVPVVDEAFVSVQLSWANRLFEPFSVRFLPVSTQRMAERYARLETRADRDGVAVHRREGALHVFFVERLRDVDEPERLRMGVHWRLRRSRDVHYVVVSKIAVNDVLAHELGHFFGNPHSDVPDNVMSYRRGGDVEPSFDDRQGRQIERSLARYLERGELRLVH